MYDGTRIAAGFLILLVVTTNLLAQQIHLEILYSWHYSMLFISTKG